MRIGKPKKDYVNWYIAGMIVAFILLVAYAVKTGQWSDPYWRGR